MKGRPEAVVIAAVLMTASACSVSPSTPPHSAKTTPASTAPTFAPVTSGCVLSAPTVARISGRSLSKAQEVQMTLTDSASAAHGCIYTGNEQGMSVLVGIGLEPARPGMTPQQYLAENHLARAQTLLLSQQDLPALGDAAKFGTVTLGGETIDVISLVQIRQGTVADLSVTVSGSSVTEDSVIALARAVLAAISV